MVKHERGEHTIERGGRIIQHIREAECELDGHAGVACLPYGSRERLLVGVDAHDLNPTALFRTLAIPALKAAAR
jgi:hypothetical protein